MCCGAFVPVPDLAARHTPRGLFEDKASRVDTCEVVRLARVRPVRVREPPPTLPLASRLAIQAVPHNVAVRVLRARWYPMLITTSRHTVEPTSTTRHSS